jgi:RimJ/RimL family protein N-acetyltransferase
MSSLRKFKLDDLDQLVEYANNPNIAGNLLDAYPSPYTVKDGEKFLERAMRDDPVTVFAICNDEKFCGAIGIHLQTDIFRKNAELGYWIAEPFWGKGIGTTAVKLICTYGFENFDLNRIFARPFGSNIASQKLLEKAGFDLEATIQGSIYKNGEYSDELIYSKLR